MTDEDDARYAEAQVCYRFPLAAHMELRAMLSRSTLGTPQAELRVFRNEAGVWYGTARGIFLRSRKDLGHLQHATTALLEAFEKAGLR
jgi:hypothetical protein